MTKRTIKMTVLFSLLIFVALSITSFLSMYITALLFKAGIIRPEERQGAFIIPLISSILAGLIISKLLSRRPIKTVEKISNAAKEISKGNYTVIPEGESYIFEFNEMAHNFNIMIKELKNTELLRKDFIENVSHEFKTPLAAIEGYATLLQSKSLSEDKRTEYTKKILFNTRRLGSLTENILLLSRLENRETQIDKNVFSLDEQLREAILLLEPKWTEKSTELDICLDACTYNANEELMLHVWLNIIDNAIKFAPVGGKVSIGLSNYQSCIILTVKDNGIGMSEETQKRVFEKFYQGDSSRSTGGNGLGLALSKRIIDLHGGDIEIISKEGSGTSFKIKLPVCSASPRP